MEKLDLMTVNEFAFFLRTELQKEHMINLDFYYVQRDIIDWWQTNVKKDFFVLKYELIFLLLSVLKEDHIKIFKSVGLAESNIALVCIKNIFKEDSPRLALLIHESLSELFHLTDIQYEYEEHKTLYLKDAGLEYVNWGSGYGEITPHSDDLYENLSTDYLALTICRDRTRTSTKCFFIRDIINNFSDEELYQLKNITACFRSGKNVNIFIEKNRNILEYSEKYGFRFFLDFRVDKLTGDRMLPCDPQGKLLLDKMRDSIRDCPYNSCDTEPGTFVIISNHKVLHARAKMNISKEAASEVAISPDLFNTPRLLYRSKGPRKEYLVP